MGRRTPTLALATVLAAGTPGLVPAQPDDGSPMRPGGGVPTGAAMGETMLTGTVTSLERAAGRFTLDAGGRRIELQLTPEAVADVASGQRVTVMFGIRPESGPTAVPGGLGR
ncbi:MAG: hypothetical protein KIT14_21385 [bacterium]|nr:hypothetical protein [bacterium]